MTASPPDAAINAVDDGGVLHAGLGDRSTVVGKLLFLIALAFSVWQIYFAAYAPVASIVARSLHVGFILLLVFGITANARRNGDWRSWLDWGLGAAGFALAFYHWVFESDLNIRAGDPNQTDLIVGCIVVALVFEAARRVLGTALPVVCTLFLSYALFGQYLPSPLNHRGYGFDQVIDQMFLGTEGIYGTPTYVSATYIFLFIVFGAFLERAGIIGLFNDLAIGSVGHTQGGPAKVSVVSSALMGTVNGSGVANVVTTGQFTIPLMKRSGFTSAFAGAVEATASMGGQIMPPVMGAVAFIMAETLGVGYAEIVRAAVIPAILYFATAFWMVHLEARRLGLKGMEKDQLPSVARALRERWHLLLPLAALVVLLFSGFTPLFAGTVGLAFTAILILGSRIATSMGRLPMKILLWIFIGLASSVFFKLGITVVFAVIAVLVAVLVFIRGGKATLSLCVESLAEGARHALPVAIACALVGIIIATMTLTGAASNFTRVIVSVGENNLFLSLLMTMVACLILGMGIPTIPNYIITSSLVGPALANLGVPLIVSHMFVFYFGIMADLTPPVALAAFAASSIAKESAMKIGLQAMRIAIAGFVVPFMAVYTPALMLQNTGDLPAAIGFIPAVAYVTVKAVLSVGLWGAAAIGYLSGPLRWWERLWAAATAFCLVAAIPMTDEIGFASVVVFIGYQVLQTRRKAAA
ncbi:TRAP transporter permease [Novispirillum itersonii]|uniref:TRAP transporter 4TM/12TM fusion protein n=1 Tax=Novispirillum itersonii TaxID=189 RepID=A0A7W9ZIW0_NOVIT|nr:TRAP transporter permease [Novispirillum itersonii]MBB6212316.1 TRAP transporter 4TM/12TM fusion protein [Novispirillum itersonii]